MIRDFETWDTTRHEIARIATSELGGEELVELLQARLWRLGTLLVKAPATRRSTLVTMEAGRTEPLVTDTFPTRVVMPYDPLVIDVPVSEPLERAA